MLFDLFISFFYINVIAYFLLLLWFILGLVKIQSSSSKTPLNIVKNISVIVCVKNEENILNNILNDLKNQNYTGNIEFIIVDDDSSDKTMSIIYDYVDKDERFKYTHSRRGNSSLSYKKRALDAGIKISQYDYLMFTDAGCRLNKDWAQSMVNQYRDGENYIIGLSFVNEPKNFVSKFQKIDLFMLMISTLSSAKLNYPLASTGQNLSYKKDVFLSISGFSKISNLMMGDDTIFMQMGLKNKSTKPGISNDPNSFVDSKIIYNWKDLLVQRIRWGGDGVIMWKYNKCFFIIMLITFLTNLFYIIAPFILHSSISFLFMLFLVKFFIEFIFYLLGSIKINKNIYIYDFIRWFFIQIPYIVLIGILSPFASYLGWKSKPL